MLKLNGPKTISMIKEYNWKAWAAFMGKNDQFYSVNVSKFRTY